MSSELSHKISILKADRTSAEIVKNADVSRETFRKIERGESVKLSTIKKIADYLKASDEQWRQLVIAWIKLEIGPEDSRHIHLSHETTAINDKLADSEQILQLASQLDSSDRKQIILAMTRPEVRRSIPAINALYDTVKRKN